MLAKYAVITFIDRLENTVHTVGQKFFNVLESYSRLEIKGTHARIGDHKVLIGLNGLLADSYT